MSGNWHREAQEQHREGHCANQTVLFQMEHRAENKSAECTVTRIRVAVHSVNERFIEMPNSVRASYSWQRKGTLALFDCALSPHSSCTISSVPFTCYARATCMTQKPDTVPAAVEEATLVNIRLLAAGGAIKFLYCSR